MYKGRVLHSWPAMLPVLLLQMLGAACTLTADQVMPSDAWSAVPFTNQSDKPTSATLGGDDFLVYHNLWFHNQRYYAITDRSSPELPQRTGLGPNTALISIPVNDVSSVYSNMQAHWLAGTTILIDFAFPAYPDNMGHWAELIAPLFCTLAASNWQQAAGGKPVGTVIFTNLGGNSLEGLDWVWEMWRVALSPLEDLAPVKFLFWDDIDAVDNQLWLGIEHLLIANDRYTHRSQRSGFWSSELGHRFRATAFRLQELQLPTEIPRTVTLLGPVSGEDVVNQLELVEHLHDVAASMDLRVRPYTVTPAAPFASFLGVMARTGILISRHGPLLTNAMFLPPGAMVIELLPYNWEWKGISRLYKNLTASVGDIHHFAWRARHPRFAVYMSPDDARYAEWAAEECQSSECLEVHAQAGMMADCEAVQELLHELLPHVLQGKSVAELDRAWPQVARDISTHRFAWDRSQNWVSTYQLVESNA